jgi:hypothetical protein
MALDLGTDLDLESDLTEECSTVPGIRCLSQALVRRWSTPRGMLLDDAYYGTDLTEYLNEDVDESVLAQMRSDIVAEAEKDERVRLAEVLESSYDFATGSVTMSVAITLPDDGTVFTLVVSITKVSVELLRVEP